MISAKLRRHVSSAVSHNMRIVDGSRNWNKKCCTVVAWRAFLKKTRKLLGPGNRPAKLPKRLSGVSQSTRKLLTPENTSFSPVNFTGVVSLPNMVVYPKAHRNTIFTFYSCRGRSHQSLRMCEKYWCDVGSES